MKLGMIGLGKMGANMAERLRQHGHEVVGYDPHADGSQVGSLQELADALAGGDQPRVAWSMVPSGKITDETITELGSLFGKGDLVIDGGNSHYPDSLRHGKELDEKGIQFIDAGTSGGVWGLKNGYSLMVGGTDEAVALAQPIFDALAPEGGFGHVGPVGAGHFTKMVHNGVEYGIMQAYAEGYAILLKSDLDIDAMAGIQSWQQGSVVRSWLLDLLVEALKEDPGLDDIEPVAVDSGEGRWTVQAAIETGVAAPVISAALFARFVSQDDSGMSMKVVSALRHQFGGHAMEMKP
jgi:6-phosphogluconate dehydrogenase